MVGIGWTQNIELKIFRSTCTPVWFVDCNVWYFLSLIIYLRCSQSRFILSSKLLLSSTFVPLLYWWRLLMLALDLMIAGGNKVKDIPHAVSSDEVYADTICFLNRRLLLNSQYVTVIALFIFAILLCQPVLLPYGVACRLIFFFINNYFVINVDVWCSLLWTKCSQASNLYHVRRLSCHHLLWYHLCTLNYFVRLPILTFKLYKFTFGLTF